MELLIPPRDVTLPPVLFTRLQNKLRLKHFSLLSALGKSPTLNLAAEELNMTQPAATKLLKDVEEVLGVELFKRHARGLTATELGEAVIEFAQTLLGQLGHFTSDIESKKSGGHGFLSIGAIMGAVPDLIGPAIARMRETYPQLTVRLLGDTSDQIMHLLEMHQIEFGICRYIADEQFSQFSFTPLGNEKLVYVASANHPLARNKKLTLKALQEETWVMQPLPSPTRVLLEEIFSRQHMPRPVKIVECSSVFAALQLLKQMQAVALLSESVVKDAIASKQITQLPLVVDGALKEYGMVQRRNTPLSPVAAEFFEFLMDCTR